MKIMPENRALTSSVSFLSLPPEIWRLVGQEVGNIYIAPETSIPLKCWRDIIIPATTQVYETHTLSRCRKPGFQSTCVPILSEAELTISL